jgi:hypothetical protein
MFHDDVYFLWRTGEINPTKEYEEYCIVRYLKERKPHIFVVTSSESNERKRTLPCDSHDGIDG